MVKTGDLFCHPLCVLVGCFPYIYADLIWGSLLLAAFPTMLYTVVAWLVAVFSEAAREKEKVLLNLTINLLSLEKLPE